MNLKIQTPEFFSIADGFHAADLHFLHACNNSSRVVRIYSNLFQTEIPRDNKSHLLFSIEFAFYNIINSDLNMQQKKRNKKYSMLLKSMTHYVGVFPFTHIYTIFSQ